MQSLATCSTQNLEMQKCLEQKTVVDVMEHSYQTKRPALQRQ